MSSRREGREGTKKKSFLQSAFPAHRALIWSSQMHFLCYVIKFCIKIDLKNLCRQRDLRHRRGDVLPKGDFWLSHGARATVFSFHPLQEEKAEWNTELLHWNNTLETTLFADLADTGNWIRVNQFFGLGLIGFWGLGGFVCFSFDVLHFPLSFCSHPCSGAIALDAIRGNSSHYFTQI